MGRITTSVGLISGFPIQETVDKLIALQGRPRDLLVQNTKKLEAQKTAVSQLTALLIGVQFAARRLASATLYNQRTVSSSQESVLAASSTGSPQLGSYSFTPLRLAQNQQLQSSRLASRSAPLGAGSFSFRFGGFIDEGLDLSLLGAGQGFERGSIRITDRSGASAEIDLSTARNIDDVIAAINADTAIKVTAQTFADRIRLVDESGGLGNLKVEEVTGSTAATLGLAGIDVADDSAVGLDVVRLFDELGLDQLNDRRGVRSSAALADFKIALRDGSEVTVDLQRLPVAGTKVSATTLSADPDARLTFTAVQAGAAYDGVTISFVDDAGVTAGDETVAYDAQAKTLVFHIDEGATTADQIVAALQRDTHAADVFTAAKAAGSSGAGLVSTSDAAVTAGPAATATTAPDRDANARVVFTAQRGGPALDNVEIRFENNDGITAGQETVAFDGSHLTFQIDEGATTVDHVIAALDNDPAARLQFRAQRAEGGDGGGLVLSSDTVFTSGGQIVEPSPGGNETTLGELLATLNAAAPGKLQAAVAPDGDRLLLTDLTADAGYTFAVTALNGSKAAADLGLLTSSGGGPAIVGKRLLGGLQTSLLRSLGGGNGIENLGLLNLTDRSGAAAQVDLTSTETIDDVVRYINGAGIGIAARINAAHNGIELADTSGGSGNLIVASGDATDSAQRLGIAVDAAVASKSSGSLHKGVVNEATRLSSYNGGAGVAAGTIRFVDSLGRGENLTVDDDVETVGDLIDRIRDLGLGIEARLNDAGDGILLVNTTSGSDSLRVEAISGSTAQDLHLLNPVKTVTIDGQERQAIDASTTATIELDADDTLDDLVRRIGEASGGVRAAVFSDGSLIKPYRFTLASQVSGRAGRLLVDASLAPFTVSETIAARDALLVVGAPGEGGLLASSATNTFADVLPDVTLTVKAPADTPVVVNVEASSQDLTSAVQQLVEAFNRLNSKLHELTAFDAETNQAATLQGDGATLRVQNDVADFLSARVFSVGPLQSLEALGVKLKDDGSLEFDSAKFQTKLSDNSAAVRDFLSRDDAGLADRLDKLMEQLSGVSSSLLGGRIQTLDAKIAANNDKVEFLNARLEAARNRLLRRFQRSETLIARIQNNLTSIASLAPLPALNLSGDSS